MNPKNVGSGSFGCVYKPSLRCDDGSFESSDDYVSKLMAADEAGVEERMMSRIKQLDPRGVFHYPIVKSCHSDFRPPRCRECRSNSCLETCCDSDNLQEAFKLNVDTGLLIYQNAGRDLHSYLHSPPHSLVVQGIKEFYLGLWRLFFGLFVLHNNDSYHLDIAPTNIMVKKTDDGYDIKFIDFGLSKQRGDLEAAIRKGDSNYLFREHMLYPPQAKLLLSVVVNYTPSPHFTPEEKRLKMRAIVHHVAYMPKPDKIISFYPHMTDYYTRMPGDEYIKNIDEDSKMFMSDDFQIQMRPIYTRIDVFMLGFCLKATAIRLKSTNPQGKDLEFTEKLDELSNDMYAMNISKRIGPRRAFIRYLKLVKDVYDVDMSDKYADAVKLIPLDRQILYDKVMTERADRAELERVNLSIQPKVLVKDKSTPCCTAGRCFC